MRIPIGALAFLATTVIAVGTAGAAGTAPVLPQIGNPVRSGTPLARECNEAWPASDWPRIAVRCNAAATEIGEESDRVYESNDMKAILGGNNGATADVEAAVPAAFFLARSAFAYWHLDWTDTARDCHDRAVRLLVDSYDTGRTNAAERAQKARLLDWLQSPIFFKYSSPLD